MRAGHSDLVLCGASGYTWVEVLLAIVFFSILAVIAIPDWNTVLPAFHLNGGARQLQAELHRIKSRAVSENTTFRLTFGATSYSIERFDGSSYLATGEIKPLPEGVDIRSFPPTLGFTARGTASPGTGGTVKLCNAKDAGTNIVVSSTGRIRICKPSACDGGCS